MICPYCKEEVAVGAILCKHCKSNISALAANITPPPNPNEFPPPMTSHQPQPIQQSFQQPHQQQPYAQSVHQSPLGSNNPKTGEPKAWTNTFLLCWFLGAYGVHRFYVGKKLSGVIQLCTLGGLGIWTFVDLISLLRNKFTDKSSQVIFRKKGEGKVALIAFASVIIVFVVSSIASVVLINTGTDIASKNQEPNVAKTAINPNKLWTKKQEAALDIGKQIAVGVATSIVEGMKLVDPELDHTLSISPKDIGDGNHSWRMIEAVIDVKSKVMKNPKIAFTLLLEIDSSSDQVIGTIAEIKGDGKPNAMLNGMKNKMFTETTEGTEQVELINGQYQSVEAPTEKATTQSQPKSETIGEGRANQTPGNILIGEWDPVPIPDDPYLLRFSEDGKFTLVAEETTTEGSYSTNGEILTMGDEFPWHIKDAKIELAGNELKIGEGDNRIEFRKR